MSDATQDTVEQGTAKSTRVYLSNDFHGTTTFIRIKLGDVLDPAQIRRIRRRLCAAHGCTCGDELGRRGRQEHNAYDFSFFPARDSAGMCLEVEEGWPENELSDFERDI